MRKIKLFISVAALLLVLIPTYTIEAATKGFKDIPADFWAEQQITYFSEQGVINGYSDGTYQPNKPITRAQAASMFASALDLVADDSFEMNYKDIDADHPTYNAIAAVTDQGFMAGTNGKFMPNKSLTRAQMAGVLANVFKLEGNGEASFKDVKTGAYYYAAIDAIVSNGVATGYANDTFKPNKPTTRAQFAVLLASAMEVDLQEDSELGQLLKAAYAKDASVESYELEGSMNLALRMPESMTTDPNFAPMAQLLGDIRVDFSGSYQKDPMMMDLTVDITLQGQLGMKLSMPIIMTEEKMWMKPPQTPLAPLPPELDGKFIEYDMQELSAMSGQPGVGAPPMMNMELQTELAVALSNLFVDHFADGFHQFVEKDAIDVPNEIDAKQVVKFELTNETVEDFMNILVEKLLPEFFALLEDPEYVKALGLTPEEVKVAQEEIGVLQTNVDQMVAELKNMLNINVFEQYSVIDQNDFITYTLTNADADITSQQETFGFGLTAKQSRTNLNEEVTITLPNKNEVVAFKQLIEMQEKLMLEQ